MMFDFDLPETFKVDKHIDKSLFINNANLTQAEKRDLKKHLKSVNIVYDVWFRDNSELIFLDVSINCPTNQYTLPRAAYCIASSLPYSTVILIHYDSLAKIFSFNCKPNQKNDLRTRIINYAGSPYFNINHPNSYLPNYPRIVDNHESAQYCCEALVDETERQASLYNNIVKDNRETEAFSDMTIDDIICILEKEEILESSNNPTYTLEDDHYYEYDDGHKRFVYDCANYCYGLFLEYCCENYCDCSNAEWLLEYIDVCNEIAHNLGFEELSASDSKEIAIEFNKGYDFRSHNFHSECFEVDVIREILNEYYC